MNLNIRLKKHLRNVKNGETEKSAIAAHAWSERHRIETKAKLLKQPISNIQMCILPEMSVVVSWMSHNENCTNVIKFSIDNDSQLVLKSTELSSVEEAVNSLHCIKDCWAVVLGENDSHIILWEHCTGVLVRKIHYPRNNTIFQWVQEDQGFLFIAASTQNHVKFIVVNLTNSKWKQLQQFSLPETHKLMGVAVDKGRLVAVLLQGNCMLGFKVWINTC
ncbi:hypothetical protein L9F63_008754 [Diploptera punctata]|uniref:Uncharacterized protein n=1 Tax=Diploptera punctata TaxID=6984 RepID=A0AAD7Z4S6_DIPPU|nr:hypothetical protein L9F63_008754 [Diploptera punctata]